MTEVDQMVMFCLMIRRRINLVRLILDNMLSTINEARRSHTAMPYGMLLTRVFARAQLPVDGHKKDEKRPTTTKKTFSAIGLKLQGPDVEGEKEKRKRKRKRKRRRKRRKKRRRSQRENKLLFRKLNQNLLKNT